MLHRQKCLFYIGTSVAGFVIVGIVTYFWPTVLPFGFFEFWTIKGSIWQAVLYSWWIFLYIIVANAISAFSKRDNYKESPTEILLKGFGVSLWAGVAEEVCFRWIIFLSGILLMPGLDALTYLVTGVHVVQQVYLFLCPIANFFTLGYLEKYLMNGYGWAVAAALMSSNGQFRNGHLYQGLRGAVMSWFAGMYFFYLMFTYGLVAAILVHFLCDLLAFSVICLDATLEKASSTRRKTFRST